MEEVKDSFESSSFGRMYILKRKKQIDNRPGDIRLNPWWLNRIGLFGINSGEVR